MTPIPFQRHNINERRRRDHERINEMRVKDTTVSGRHLIIGLGRTWFEIPFPVQFSTRPFVQFGVEMDDGFVFPEDGIAIPKLHAFVASWEKSGEIPGALDGYYNGCVIGVTAEGVDEDQRAWLHYSFRAHAMRNPVSGLEELDETL